MNSTNLKHLLTSTKGIGDEALMENDERVRPEYSLTEYKTNVKTLKGILETELDPSITNRLSWRPA
jgi:hypothetical protein